VPKLRVQIVLPVMQLIGALVLLAWGRGMSQSARLDFPYSPTPVLICNGINAPAALFSLSASLLPLEKLDRGPISIFGLGAQSLFFLAGVVVLWYLVGRAIDHAIRRQGLVGPQVRGWVSRSLIDAALMLLATLLLLVGVTPILDSRGFTNPAGAVAAAFLWLAWFLVLFFVPGIDLVRGFRARHVDARS
jgi:hypothetical protein